MGNSKSNTPQESRSNNNRSNVNQSNGRISSEQTDSVNNVPLHKNIGEHNEKSDTYTRTQLQKDNMKTRYTNILNHTLYRHYIYSLILLFSLFC